MPSAGRTYSSQSHPSSSSTTTFTSHHSPPMSDEEDPTPPPPSSTRTPVFPTREDCWSEDATHTLIDAWGSHYLKLNRGSLRQQHWEDVCDTVNALHAHFRKLQRTDVQCKNRIDTLKKKYKLEKLKSLETCGQHVSTWPFFNSLDNLIGQKFAKSNPTTPFPPAARTRTRTRTRTSFVQEKRVCPVLLLPPYSVPVGPRSKRPAPKPVSMEDEDGEDSDRTTTPAPKSGGMEKRRKTVESGSGVDAEGFMKLADAIGGFGEVYERVEEAKQRQLLELEKQRMQFSKDLEIQRMKLFMESQVELEKLKRSARNSPSGEMIWVLLCSVLA